MIDMDLSVLNASNEDLDFLYKMSKDINEDLALSTESFYRYAEIAKRYKLDTTSISVEDMGKGMLVAIGAAIAAVFIFIFGLIKKLIGSSGNRNDVLKEAVNNGTVANNVVKAKENISNAVRQVKSTPIKEVNITKLEQTVTHDCAKATTILAQAYKMYLDLTKENINGKTIEDMDKWLDSIKSSKGDVLKIVQRSFIENPTLKERLSGDLHWLNFGNGDFDNLIKSLTMIENRIMKYATEDSYGNEWGGCVSAINDIEWSINNMIKGRERTDFSRTMEINISFIEKAALGDKSELQKIDNVINDFKRKGYENESKWENVISDFNTYLASNGGNLDNVQTRENGWVSDADSLTRMIFKRFSKAIIEVTKLYAQRSSSIARLGEYIIKSSEIAKKLSDVGEL